MTANILLTFCVKIGVDICLATGVMSNFKKTFVTLFQLQCCGIETRLKGMQKYSMSKLEMQKIVLRDAYVYKFSL